MVRPAICKHPAHLPTHGARRFCPQCKVKRKTKKQLSLSRLPPILLIHLKRFSLKVHFTDKVDKLVEFPLRALDLTNYMPAPLPPGADRGQPQEHERDDPRTQLPSYRYDLYGVTNHFGSLSSGHCASLFHVPSSVVRGLTRV
jgi:ubiquitin carboxyl-terminal hydrolase 8